MGERYVYTGLEHSLYKCNICSIFVHTNVLFDKVWTHLNTFVCSLAHLSVFVSKQMLYLSYIYTAFVHICLRSQMHHYPICLKDKCHICISHKCEQIWQISYLDHICLTFISFQICFFIQCKYIVLALQVNVGECRSLRSIFWNFSLMNAMNQNTTQNTTEV